MRYDEHLGVRDEYALLVYAGYEASSGHRYMGVSPDNEASFPAVEEVSATAAPGAPTATSFTGLEG